MTIDTSYINKKDYLKINNIKRLTLIPSTLYDLRSRKEGKNRKNME